MIKSTQMLRKGSEASFGLGLLKSQASFNLLSLPTQTETNIKSVQNEKNWLLLRNVIYLINSKLRAETLDTVRHAVCICKHINACRHRHTLLKTLLAAVAVCSCEYKPKQAREVEWQHTDMQT